MASTLRPSIFGFHTPGFNQQIFSLQWVEFMDLEPADNRGPVVYLPYLQSLSKVI